jgi:hypothetical protein
VTLLRAIPLLLVLVPVAAAADVSVRVVDDYVFGGYRGEFQCPPSADNNPRRAVIVEWAGQPWRFVFAHEGSYCPWFELADGSGACFQFFEGNDGWAELFNQFGRMENEFLRPDHRSRPEAGSRPLDVLWRQPDERAARVSHRRRFSLPAQRPGAPPPGV